MAEVSLNFALETFRDLVVGEISLLRGVRGQVEEVERGLRRIHGLLMTADRVKRDSPTLKECFSNLEKLAFEAETVLERYAVEVQSKKEGRRRLKEKFQRYICILSECASVHEVGQEAQDILSRLSDLRQELESEIGQQRSSQRSHEEDEQQRLLRQTYAHEVERYFVGMEEDIENLVSMVKDDETIGRSRSRFIKIYGMGGLGKTTLARKIYNRAEFASYARAWVCITQQLQPHAALSTILKQLDREAKTNEMDAVELVVKIHQILEGKQQSLIVIDDIWKTSDWEIIRPAFPIDCKVLITTRDMNVGNHECRNYELRLLTEDEGWDLLQKIALEDVDPHPGETILKSLEEIGRQIVAKCGRLPISISLMGGLLRQEQVRLTQHWAEVNRKVGYHVTNEEKRVEGVLGLSYDSLPYYLKPCFLYLACFPEDTEIDTDRLYLLWMAEGFVSHQDKGRNEALKDVAQRYLTELAMRCMVQVVHKENTSFPFNKSSSCRLHDLMHNLCSSKVDEGTEKFLKRVDLFSRDRSEIPSSIGNSSSRLVINCDSSTDRLRIEGLEKVKKLRCLMVFEKPERIDFEDSVIDLGKSPCLRILALDGCKFEGGKLPTKVCNLIHLRYLSLRESNVGELPAVWCTPYLQTLDLRYYYNKIRVPNVIWKMKRLRHLFLTSKKIELIEGEKLRLDGLLELETLDGISSEIACVADILKLISLKKLGITISDLESMSVVADLMSKGRPNESCETNFSVEPSSIVGQKIDLNSEIGRDAIQNVLMSPSLVTLRFYKCNVGHGFGYYEEGMCKNLVKVMLMDCEVAGDVMEKLGRYPILRTLCLAWVDFGTTETLIFPSNSFPQLNVLSMNSLSNVRELQVEETAMPKLTYFNIDDSQDRKNSATSIKIHVPREFVDRVRGQGGTATIRSSIGSYRLRGCGRRDGEVGQVSHVANSHLEFGGLRDDRNINFPFKLISTTQIPSNMVRVQCEGIASGRNSNAKTYILRHQ